LTEGRAASPRPSKRFARWTVLGSLIVSLIAAEVLLRRFAPLPDPYAREKEPPSSKPKPISSEFPPQFSFATETEPGLPGMTAVRRRFTTNNAGFRGAALTRPKPHDEYRVFMVGGSTTEDFYLDDTEALTFVLQGELNRSNGARQIRVYGAGKGGDMSADHLAMISQRIVHLEPDLIILFCGMNDLTAAIHRLDYCFFPERKRPGYSLLNLAAFAATEFQLSRYAYAPLRRIFRPSSREILETVTERSTYRAKVQVRKRAPVARERPRTDLPSYEENLKSIIGIARANGIALALVTQASSWNSKVDGGMADWHWMTYRHNVNVSYPEEWMDAALESYNGVMRRLGQESGVPVFDLANAIGKSREFFYDDCHFNVAGARRAAEQLGGFVSDRFLRPAATEMERRLERPRPPS
jgi:lysophospholipase L1-like esterase